VTVAGPRGPGISVIIVSYNVREILDACLQSVYHAAARFSGTVEVIVFDNESRDGTVSLLKPRWPEATWISSDRNLGFGSGCNRGAAVATQPLLLFLNPDTLMREDTLQVMWDFFRSHADAGVAGCKIVNRDGSLQLACKRSFPSPRVAAFKLIGLGSLFPKSRVFGRYNLTYLDENTTHEVDAVSGSFLCISSELFREIGGFDEDFFMYGEDLDLCFRAKLLGKRNYYHPITQVIHFKGESAKSRPLGSFLDFHAAMVIFSKKHLELRALPLILLNAGVAILALAKFISSRFQKWPRWFADLLIVNLVLGVVAYVYVHAKGHTLFSFIEPSVYVFWNVLTSLAVVLPLAYAGEYGSGPARPRKVFLSVGISFLAVFSLSFFMKEHAYSRVVFAISSVLSAALLTSWRLAGSHGGRFWRKVVGGVKRVVILGTAARARTLAALIQNETLEGYECVGFIHFPAGPVPQEVRANVIGDLETLPTLARKLDLQAVIIALDEGTYPAALRVLAAHGAGSLEIKMLVGDPEPGKNSLIDLNFRN
jgi:GT2 family glycosyltransferase